MNEFHYLNEANLLFSFHPLYSFFLCIFLVRKSRCLPHDMLGTLDFPHYQASFDAQVPLIKLHLGLFIPVGFCQHSFQFPQSSHLEHKHFRVCIQLWTEGPRLQPPASGQCPGKACSSHIHPALLAGYIDDLEETSSASLLPTISLLPSLPSEKVACEKYPRSLGPVAD